MNLSANISSSPATTTHFSSNDGFTAGGILKALAVLVLILGAVIGNLVVCVSFTLFRNLRTITNYLLVSLSVADLLIALCVMPFWLVNQLYQPRIWPRPDQNMLIQFVHVMDIWLCLSSVLSLTAISVERNLAISHPFCYTKWLSPSRVYLTIAFSWLFALLVALIATINPFGKKSSVSLFFVITCYFLPLMIVIAMYSQILIVARRQARRLRQDGALATDFKAIKTIAIVVGAYFICYTPFMLFMILLHFNISSLTPSTMSVIKWLTYFNSCVNPIIYSCFNRTYRGGFKRLFQTLKKRCHELRLRACGKSSNDSRKSHRLSFNPTLRTSAGSLLDGSKLATESYSLSAKRSSFPSSLPTVADNNGLSEKIKKIDVERLEKEGCDERIVANDIRDFHQ